MQIGGAAKDVFIIENEIEGGDRNGVALGSVRFLDANGADTRAATGVVWSGQDNCATNVGNQIPPTVGNYRVVAGARLVDITIARDRIRRMGLSGIGPVGVFDLVAAIETISIENLTISGNAIEGCLNWPLGDNGFGYGAISTPDVKALRVFDNSIVDFGATPGAANAWGVYVLFGELLEISRNRIVETRDFALTRTDEKGAPSTGRGGIAIAGVAPPSFTSNAVEASWAPADTTYVPAAISPAFEPGLPALRIENNVVRVACGMALAALGLGPFSILGNHLATGGPAPISEVAIATTVLLLNLGRPIEFDQPYDRYSGLYAARLGASNSLAAATLGASTDGTLLFANNVCQLEARASKEHGYTSVLAATSTMPCSPTTSARSDGPRDARFLRWTGSCSA